MNPVKGDRVLFEFPAPSSVLQCSAVSASAVTAASTANASARTASASPASAASEASAYSASAGIAANVQLWAGTMCSVLNRKTVYSA